MTRSPYTLVRTLLEEEPILPADNFDPKDFALEKGGEIRSWPGEPITGYYQKLLGLFNEARRKHYMADGSPYVKLPLRNTFLVKYHDSEIAVRYHETDIIQVTPDDNVRVSTGGWHTVTTGGRLDEYLPGGWATFRRFTRHGGAEQLYWYNRAHPISGTTMHIEQPLSDGDTITPDGTLYPKEPPIMKKKIQRRAKSPPTY